MAIVSILFKIDKK